MGKKVRKAVELILSIAFAVTLQGQTPLTAQDYLKSSLAHFQSGDTEAALADVNKAIALNSNDVDAFALRAAIRSRKGDTEGTLADYSKVIELVPNAPGVEAIYTNRSMIRLQRGDVDGALTDLNKAISINPNVAEIYNGRAIARLQKGDLEGALADYEKVIELKPTLPSAFMGRGYFRLQRGDLDGAFADFDKAIDLKPDYADTYIDRGVVRGLKGNIDQAIADIKKGASLNPKSISDVSRGSFTSPFGDLNTFIKSHPTNARAYEIRGILRLLQGQTAEAQRDFHTSMEIDPKLGPEITEVTGRLSKTR
jgi:tetratricopeptide (TPR) repeat protein